MENWIVASSNAPALVAIWFAAAAEDYPSAVLLVLAAFFSFGSHLVENHKHGMPGAIQGRSIGWNRCDRAAVVWCCLRAVYLFVWHRWPSLWLLLSMAFFAAFNLASEWDKTRDTKWFYVMLHCVWHIGIWSCIALYFWPW